MAEQSRYFWIKLRTDFFADDSPMDVLLSQKNGSEYVCLYLKLCLTTANKEGRLCNQFGEVIIPYDAEKIQRDMKYFSIDTVRVALEMYRKLGLIYEETDGVLTITNHEDMVGSEGQSAKRMRAKRDRDRITSHCDINVTEDKSHCDTEIDIRDKSKSKNNKEEKALSDIMVFFLKYPDVLKEFEEFVKMRKQIKKPMSEHAKDLALEKLKRLSTDSGGFNPVIAIQILSNSIEGSWTGLYELKGDAKTVKKNKFTNFEGQNSYDYDALEKELTGG